MTTTGRDCTLYILLLFVGLVIAVWYATSEPNWACQSADYVVTIDGQCTHVGRL